eukprot:m.1194 g.1194  ORF g.1194 m.1194 type:complete len:443 (+) comp5865_c0_seq1:17-1345(+)
MENMASSAGTRVPPIGHEVVADVDDLGATTDGSRPAWSAGDGRSVNVVNSGGNQKRMITAFWDSASVSVTGKDFYGMVTAERVNTDHADKLAGAIKDSCTKVTPLLSNQEPLTVVLRFDSKDDYDKMGAELKSGKLQPLLPQISGYEITRLEPVFQTAAHSLAHVEIKPMQFQFPHVIASVQALVGQFSELFNFVSFTCENNPSSVEIPSLHELSACQSQTHSVDAVVNPMAAKRAHLEMPDGSGTNQISLCILLLFPSDLSPQLIPLKETFLINHFLPVLSMSGMTPSQQFEKYFSFPHLPSFPLSTLPLFGLYGRQSVGVSGKTRSSAAIRLNMYVSCDLVIMEQFYSSILDQRPFKGREGRHFFLIYSLSSAVASNVELYIYYCPECKIIVTEGVTLHFVVADLVLAANQLGENLLKKLGPSSYMTVDPQEHLVILHSV